MSVHGGLKSAIDEGSLDRFIVILRMLAKFLHRVAGEFMVQRGRAGLLLRPE
jgi:hypothetical protein